MTKRAQSPYPYVKSVEGSRIVYTFETDRKVRYQAYFSDYGYMFGTHSIPCQFLSFDLVVVDSIRPPKGTPTDKRIADTVRAIFTEIFQVVDNVVTAIYDSADQGEHARHRKFDQWFREGDLDYIEKVNFQVEGNDYMLISSVFLHADLPDKEEILDRYQLVLEGGNIPLD